MDDIKRRMGRGIGLLFLRVSAGLLMMSHGWQKLTNFSGMREQMPDPIGIGKTLSLIGTIGAEFFMAALVTIGLATRLAAAPIVFTMMVAAFVVHAADPFGDKEKAILFAIIFFVLILTGPGRFSLDHFLWPRIKKRRETRRQERKFMKKHDVGQDKQES